MRSKFTFAIFSAGLFLLSQAATAQNISQDVTIAKQGGTFPYSLLNGPFSDCGNRGTIKNANPSVATISPFPSFSTPGSTSPFTVTGVSNGTDQIQIFYTADPSCTYSSGIITLNVTVGTPVIQVPPTFGSTPNAGSDGEPVSTATGELFGYDEAADLTTNGPLPLGFRRYYASYLSANGVATALGTNWMSNFDVSLTVSGTTAKATLFRGKFVTFKQANGAWQLSSTEQLPFQLIAAGGGYQLLDPRSNRVYGFNSAGALTRIQDRNGNALIVTPGVNGPTQVSDALGRTLTFTYTGSNLTRVQDQAGRAVTFEYTSGNLAAFSDANAKRTTFAYTASGGINALMTSATLPNGNQPFSQTFDSQGRVATQSHAVGATMTFTYNTVTTASSPTGPALTFAHDQNFNLTSRIDASGVGSKATYDAGYRLLSSTDRTGATQSQTYDAASGLPTAYTDALGNRTTFKYTSTTVGGFTFYDLTGTTFADGTSVTYTPDGKGNVTALSDQAGKTWQFTYNSAGQMITRTNPSGAVTTLSYGSDASLTSVQLPSADTTALSYDAAKRLNLVTNPDSTAVALRYDARDNLTGSTNEKGATTATSFDANNNVRTVVDALNATGTFSYDADDRLSSRTDALGRAAVRAYDTMGRLQSVTDASGVATSYVYDSLNRATQVLDGAGKGLTLAWDQEARIASTSDALSRTTTFTRDARGLLTAVKTPKNETSTVAYDAFGRPSSSTDPLSRTTSYHYDPRGLLSSLNLPGGVGASYSFNELGRLSALTDPNGNLWSRAYDKQGRLTSRTDPLGQTISRQYDSRQRVSAVSYPQGSLKYTYDPVGKVTARTWSDGTNLTYAYDPDNRLTSATGVALSYDANGRISASNGLQISRDPAGRIAAISYAAGKTVKYTYDNRGLLTQVADWVGGAVSFTYDAAHQLTSRTFPNGVAENFTYDADGRYTAIQVAKGGTAISSISLTRDALGRVTSAVRSASAVSDVPTGYFGNVFDPASQSYASTYDSLGRVTQDALAARTYTWDLASRLASYSGANGAASFTYDAFGQRISSTTGGVTQNYVLNYALPLPSVATIQSGGADLRYYIWLPNGTLLESIEASGARHFYHFDESGTTNVLTGDSGAVTDSYAGTPFGETMVQTGSTPNPFTFQGAFGVMQEGATGLYYMRARYYDSASARFLSRDPVSQRNPRAISPYQFAYANPLQRADPSGLESIDFAIVLTRAFGFNIIGPEVPETPSGPTFDPPLPSEDATEPDYPPDILESEVQPDILPGSPTFDPLAPSGHASEPDYPPDILEGEVQPGNPAVDWDSLEAAARNRLLTTISSGIFGRAPVTPTLAQAAAPPGAFFGFPSPIGGGTPTANPVQTCSSFLSLGCQSPAKESVTIPVCPRYQANSALNVFASELDCSAPERFGYYQ